MTRLLQPVLDAVDPVSAAAFHLAWLGDAWGYRGGAPAPDADWVVIVGPGGARIAFADPDGHPFCILAVAA